MLEVRVKIVVVHRHPLVLTLFAEISFFPPSVPLTLYQKSSGEGSEERP